MKRILSLTLAIALLAALFTGCGCMDRNVSNHPGGMITEEPTIMPHPTATHATEPTRATEPHATTLPRATDPTGNGTEATGEKSAPTDATVPHNRARNAAR